MSRTDKDAPSNEKTPLLDHTEPAAPSEQSKAPPRLVQELQIALIMVLVTFFGSGNRVASKIMTQPMQNYSFFLSLFNPIMYVTVYFTILFVRYARGIATKDMLLYPWKPYAKDSSSRSFLYRCWRAIPPAKYFLLMGLLDGLGTILAIIATPNIAGSLLPILSQPIILYTMIVSVIILGTKYTYWQIWCVFLVITGAVTSLLPNLSGQNDQTSSLWYSLLMAISPAPNAISFTLKELVFKERPGLDLFIVNSHGSLFQLLLWPIFLPLAILLGQTGKLSFSEYVANGFQCFLGHTPSDVTPPHLCDPMPLPYIVYITFNLLYNIFTLLLLKKASALLSFMAGTAILPISVLLFYFNWPLIGPQPINMFIIIGLIVILVGLVLYRYMTYLRDKHKLGCMSCWLPFFE